MLLSNSGHYIWYIYLNFAVTQTDDCDLGLIWCVEDGEVSSLQFILVSMAEINNSRTVLYFTGSFFIDFLPCSDCQILKTIYYASQDSVGTYYFINILHNMCPEIIIMSSLTQQLFNSGYDKWLPSRKYMMSHVFSN